MSLCGAAYSHTDVFTLFTLVRHACSNVADADAVQAINSNTPRGLHSFVLSRISSGFCIVSARISHIDVAVAGAAQVSFFEYSPGEAVAGWFLEIMGQTCTQLKIIGNGACWIHVHAQCQSFIVVVVIVVLHERATLCNTPAYATALVCLVWERAIFVAM